MDRAKTSKCGMDPSQSPSSPNDITQCSHKPRFELIIALQTKNFRHTLIDHLREQTLINSSNHHHLSSLIGCPDDR